MALLAVVHQGMGGTRVGRKETQAARGARFEDYSEEKPPVGLCDSHPRFAGKNLLGRERIPRVLARGSR